METIILHSKEKDFELIKELRGALIEKGFSDFNKPYNDAMAESEYAESVILWHDDRVGVHTNPLIGTGLIIPVSRNDFQTMFLLY